MIVSDVVPLLPAQSRNPADAKSREMSDIVRVPGPVFSPDEEGDGAAIAAEQPSDDAVSAAVSRLNDYVESVDRSLRFSVDEVTGRTVIRVLDARTDEVLREIPPQRLLAMMHEIATPNEAEGLKGLLVRETV